MLFKLIFGTSKKFQTKLLYFEKFRKMREVRIPQNLF